MWNCHSDAFFLCQTKSTFNGKYLKKNPRAEAFKPRCRFIDVLFLPAVTSDEEHQMFVTRDPLVTMCPPHPRPGIDFSAAFLPLHRAEADIGWIGEKIDALVDPKTLAVPGNIGSPMAREEDPRGQNWEDE